MKLFYGLGLSEQIRRPLNELGLDNEKFVQPIHHNIVVNQLLSRDMSH